MATTTQYVALYAIIRLNGKNYDKGDIITGLSAIQESTLLALGYIKLYEPTEETPDYGENEEYIQKIYDYAKNLPAQKGTLSSPIITVQQTYEVGTGATRITSNEYGRVYIIIRATDSALSIAEGWYGTTEQGAVYNISVPAGQEVLIFGDNPIWAKATTATIVTISKEVRP